jgi:hypothetical protein
VVPPSGGVGLSPPRGYLVFIAPRSVLIKICANKKIGEERRGETILKQESRNLEYEGKTNLK